LYLCLVYLCLLLSHLLHTCTIYLSVCLVRECVCVCLSVCLSISLLLYVNCQSISCLSLLSFSSVTCLSIVSLTYHSLSPSIFYLYCFSLSFLSLCSFSFFLISVSPISFSCCMHLPLLGLSSVPLYSLFHYTFFRSLSLTFILTF
jgi:hypothetical protein